MTSLFARRALTLALVSVLGTGGLGCGKSGSTPPADGGTDAGPPGDAGGGDAGPGPMDAGVTDAATDAPIDATMPVDAGPPTLGGLRTLIEMDHDMLGSSMAGFSSAEQESAEFLQLHIITTLMNVTAGPAGIVGIDGVLPPAGGTVALPVAAVPTLACVRVLDMGLAQIATLEAAWAASTDTRVTAILGELDLLKTHVQALRSGLATRFRQIVNAGLAAGLTPRDDPEYQLSRSFVMTGGPQSVYFVGEGQGSTGLSTTLGVTCSSETTGSPSMTVDVYDEEDNTQIMERTGSGSLSFPLPLPMGTDTPLRVVITGPVPDSVGFSSCTASLSGERHLRGNPVTFDATAQASISPAQITFNNTMSFMGPELDSLRAGTGDPDVLDVVARYAAWMSTWNSAWTDGSFAFGSPAVSDLEMMQIFLTRVQPALDAAFAGSAALAPTDYGTLRRYLLDCSAASSDASAAVSAALP